MYNFGKFVGDPMVLNNYHESYIFLRFKFRDVKIYFEESSPEKLCGVTTIRVFIGKFLEMNLNIIYKNISINYIHH